MFREGRRLLLLAGMLVLLPLNAFATVGSPCPRPPPGSVVTAPPELFSHNGVLNVAFNYFTPVDAAGRTLFCFTTADGYQGPTLHVMPGDTLNVTVTNQVPAPPPGSPTEVVSSPGNTCGDATMTVTSLNVHYHGTNTAPQCHSDEVIHTIINSGESFQFNPRVVGLRGDSQETKEAARQFHVYYRMRSLGEGEYSVDHSSFLYVVNPEGQFTKLLADSLSADQLAAELTSLTRQEQTRKAHR